MFKFEHIRGTPATFSVIDVHFKRQGCFIKVVQNVNSPPVMFMSIVGVCSQERSCAISDPYTFFSDSLT